jgi:hypothetical protein
MVLPFLNQYGSKREDAMFAVATENEKIYAVGIYNKDVRRCVKANETHQDYADEWADVHYQNVVAETEQEALILITDKYPPQEGFVVTSLNIEKRRF